MFTLKYETLKGVSIAWFHLGRLKDFRDVTTVSQPE